MKRNTLLSMGRSVALLSAVIFGFSVLNVSTGPTASDCMHDLLADDGMPAVMHEYRALVGQLMRQKAERKAAIQRLCVVYPQEQKRRKSAPELLFLAQLRAKQKQ